MVGTPLEVEHLHPYTLGTASEDKCHGKRQMYTRAKDPDCTGKEPKIEREPIDIGIIMPKQSRGFTLNYFTTDTEEMEIKKINIDFAIKYKFLKYEKKSKFNYYKICLFGYEITCVEAD